MNEILKKIKESKNWNGKIYGNNIYLNGKKIEIDEKFREELKAEKENAVTELKKIISSRTDDFQIEAIDLEKAIDESYEKARKFGIKKHWGLGREISDLFGWLTEGYN